MNRTIVANAAFLIGKYNQIDFLECCLNDAAGLVESNKHFLDLYLFGKNLEKKPTPNRVVLTESRALHQRIEVVKWRTEKLRLARWAIYKKQSSINRSIRQKPTIYSNQCNVMQIWTVRIVIWMRHNFGCFYYTLSSTRWNYGGTMLNVVIARWTFTLHTMSGSQDPQWADKSSTAWMWSTWSSEWYHERVIFNATIRSVYDSTEIIIRKRCSCE